MDPSPLDILDSFSGSLDELEKVLEPLLSHSLAENAEGLDLIQKSKLNVLITYVVQDLVFMYLKTKGVDPSTHPVSEELKRVKSYFDKISQVENPETRSLQVDKAAANRFIKAAISRAQLASADAAFAAASEKSENQDTVAAFPKHIRFNLVKPPRQEGPVSDDESSEDEDLEIIEDVDHKGKGKSVDERSVATEPAKKRKAMDPFAGYSSNASSKTANGQDNGAASEASSSKAPKKKKSRTKQRPSESNIT